MTKQSDIINLIQSRLWGLEIHEYCFGRISLDDDNANSLGFLGCIPDEILEGLRSIAEEKYFWMK